MKRIIYLLSSGVLLTLGTQMTVAGIALQTNAIAAINSAIFFMRK